MTGFGSAVAGPAEGPGGSGTQVLVELRSVNGRFLDLSLRLPDEWRALEPALRELVATHVRRGKVELRAAWQRDGGSDWPAPTGEVLHRLAQVESRVLGWLPDARPLSVNEALQWCRGGTGGGGSPDTVLAAAERAVEALAQARAREGDRLAAVLRERIGELRRLADLAEPLVPQVVQRQRERFLERFNEALSAAGATPSQAQAPTERALSEAAAYAIRIDVAEELARLRAHCDEIERLLRRGGELGKRLDFLIQELHREANTLGSKSQALELTQIAVDLKVAIEQMREQVQNIE